MKWICPQCGTENGELLNACTACGADRPADALPPAATPFAPAAKVDSPIPAGAGFWIRALARVIDLVCGMAISFPLGLATGIVFAILSHLGRITPEWPQLIGQSSAMTYGSGIVGMFLYHALAEGLGGATIGKLICGLRVVGVDGRPAKLNGAFVRDLAYHIDALFFGIVGYISMEKTPLRQRYGDVWGRTVVVKAKLFESTPPRGPGRITLGILLGGFFWGATQFLAMLLQVI